jgi:AP2-associated kinase
MRRGRPTTGPQSHAAKPSPSPLRTASNDPFAALDGKPSTVQGDELSSRFPSLDQFSLLHDGGKFDFDASSPTMTSHKDADQRATEQLADSAFATPKSRTPVPSTTTVPSSTVSRAQKIISRNPELQSVTPSPNVVYQPTPMRGPTSSYVSTGTMTSPSPPSTYVFPPASDRHRSVSLPRNQEANSSRNQHLHQEGGLSMQASSLSSNPSYRPQLGHVRHPSSSRPSLEGRAPASETLDPVVRAKSSNAQSRPSNTYLDSNIDFLRERESSGRRSMDTRGSSDNRRSAEIRKSMDNRPSYPIEPAATESSPEEDTHINSNVDFLRSMEDQETSKKTKRRSTGSNNKPKRSSLPSMSLSGTKTLLAGKFGDAFKRFENNASAPPGPRTPSPLQDMERRDLTPIAGSEATDGRSDDGMLGDDTNMSQEQRRDMERRRLSMEEKRVADAAAEYRRQLAGRGPAPRSIGGVSRATTIQNKVKNLLDESSQVSPVKKTAEGYGRFTEHELSPQPNQFDPSNPYAKPVVGRKPLLQAVLRGRGAPSQKDINYSTPRAEPVPVPSAVSKTGGPRPSAPPKPMHLNSISTGPQGSPPKQSSLPGRPIQARPDMTQQEKEDYIADFSKRFPSLSGIEMVEREIEMDSNKRDDGRSRSKVV